VAEDNKEKGLSVRRKRTGQQGAFGGKRGDREEITPNQRENRRKTKTASLLGEGQRGKRGIYAQRKAGAGRGKLVRKRRCAKGKQGNVGALTISKGEREVI